MKRKYFTKGRYAAMARGLTNGEIARSVGVSESYVVAILSGRVKPAFEVLQRMAQILGISPEEVQEEVEIKNPVASGQRS